MKKTFEQITQAQAVSLYGQKDIYILMPVLDETPMGEFMNAFLVAEQDDPKPNPKPKQAKTKAKAKSEPVSDAESQLKQQTEAKQEANRVDHTQVVELRKQGKSIASIGMALHCSDQTVRNHIKEAVKAGELKG